LYCLLKVGRGDKRGVLILLIEQIKSLAEITKRLTVLFDLVERIYITGSEKINKINP
jgi:hypothetical protein